MVRRRSGRPGTGPQELGRIADAVRPSLVRVEYTFKHDKGEAPSVFQYPNTWQDHGIDQERPLEVVGFALAPNRILTPELVVHPRFLKGIAVRAGTQLAEARPAAYLKDQPGVILDLARPLEGVKPLVFDAAAPPPYFAVSSDIVNAEWVATVKGISSTVAVTEGNVRYVPAPSASVIVAKGGIAVGVCLNERLPLDGSWKGSPERAASIRADELADTLSKLEQSAAKSLVRVHLTFRSPRATPGEAFGGRVIRRVIRWRGPLPSKFLGAGDEKENATEMDVVGVVTGGKVVVLADLKPKQTARLEKIWVYPEGADSIEARFAGTLKDYGAFVADPVRPLPVGAVLSTEAVTGFRDRLLYGAEVFTRGETRLSYVMHRRIAGFELGWKRQLRAKLVGEEEKVFLFDKENRLVALPLAPRDLGTDFTANRGHWSFKGSELLSAVFVATDSTGNRRHRSFAESGLLPAVYLAEVLKELSLHLDRANVPLREEEEERLAWLGVELQPLNAELARANHVSDQTNDGSTGAIVTFVYPDSPAARAGVEAGWVILRLHTDDRPAPIEVKIQEGETQEFPWELLDDADDEQLEQLPTPWPSVENSLNRTLTDLGFGKKFTAEFANEGKLIVKEFEVTPSPPHYAAAARFHSEALGITVRNLTYEVRRYLRKKNEDPGVIVSKAEDGGKAAVAGIRRYELITHVDGRPVTDVQEFEKLVQGKEELELSVTRRYQGRVVKVKLGKEGGAARPEPGKGGAAPVK